MGFTATSGGDLLPPASPRTRQASGPSRLNDIESDHIYARLPPRREHPGTAATWIAPSRPAGHFVAGDSPSPPDLAARLDCLAAPCRGRADVYADIRSTPARHRAAWARCAPDYFGGCGTSPGVQMALTSGMRLPSGLDNRSPTSQSSSRRRAPHQQPATTPGATGAAGAQDDYPG